MLSELTVIISEQPGGLLQRRPQPGVPG